jgi:hypothetical protein
MLKKRYYHIRDCLISRHQELCEAAKARGEETCSQTGKALIDLSQDNVTVLAALSRKELLVRDRSSESNEKFILTVEPATESISRKSVTMKTFRMEFEVQLFRDWQEEEEELLFPRYDPENRELSKESWDNIAARLPGR